ncbi:hypothetical protein HGA89_07020, partial [bacterium]|nr:hypothetical protein [bacterium]
MARVGPLAAADIDALWAALRPRILGLGTGSGGTQGPAGPKGVNWRGEWAEQTDYEVGDLVYRDTTGGGTAELVTYYALTDHTSLAGSPPAPGGDTQWWELGNAYLIIDGSRAMTGDLNMGEHDVDAAVNGHFSGDLEMDGGVGVARVANPRVISMAGDHEDDEAKIEGLERVVFNDEPTASSIEQPSRIEMNTGVEAGVDYTAAEGVASWDTLE